MFTCDEVKRLAPGYREKLESLDPSKVGKKVPKPPQKRQPTTQQQTRRRKLPVLTYKSSKSTGQRNDSIIFEAIFGIDLTVSGQRLDKHYLLITEM